MIIPYACLVFLVSKVLGSLNLLVVPMVVYFVCSWEFSTVNLILN